VCACVSPPGEVVIVALYDASLVFLNVSALLPTKTFALNFHGASPTPVMLLRINGVGSQLLVDCYGNKPNLHVYDAYAGVLLFRLHSPAKVCYSFDYRHIYGGSRVSTAACLAGKLRPDLPLTVHFLRNAFH
jgi:hypothetical protein